jgi:hypothetical protein
VGFYVEKRYCGVAGRFPCLDMSYYPPISEIKERKNMPILTWGGRSTFDYNGCIETGTEILFGENSTRTITTHQWQALRQQFLGRVVEIGTSRDNPPPGSMGEWFYPNIYDQALMSYVGVILVRECYAVRESDTTIRVVR